MKTLFIALALLALVGGRSAHGQSFVLIVNARNPVHEITRDQAARLFLKKSVTWSDGGSVTLVDQERDSKVREAFTQHVLGRSIDAVDIYWQSQIFSGKGVPPATKGSDAEVVAFVAADPYAMGYVATGTVLTREVHTVSITGG